MATPNTQNFKDQISAYLAGLSEDEKATFIKELSSGEVPKDVPTEWKDKTVWQSQIAPALSAFYQGPEGKAHVAEMIRNRASDRFVKRYKPALNLVLQGADIFTSLSQINSSNKALAKLAQPTIPNAPGVDPALNNQIYNAQQGTFDQSRALAPARQAISDAYAAQDNANRQISGGQAGEYGSRTQAAYNERLRASGQLPMIADNIRAREQQRLDGLIGTRAQLAQQNYSNSLQGTQMALNQYNTNVNSAAALGAQGRANLRNVFTTLPENLTRYAGGFTGNVAQDPYGYGAHLEQQVANHIVRNKNNSAVAEQQRLDQMRRRPVTNEFFNPVQATDNYSGQPYGGRR